MQTVASSKTSPDHQRGSLPDIRSARDSLPDNSHHFKYAPLSKNEQEVRLVYIKASTCDGDPIRLVIEYACLVGRNRNPQDLSLSPDNMTDEIREKFALERLQPGSPLDRELRNAFVSLLIQAAQKKAKKRATKRIHDVNERMWQDFMRRHARCVPKDRGDRRKPKSRNLGVDATPSNTKDRPSFTALSYAWGP